MSKNIIFNNLHGQYEVTLDSAIKNLGDFKDLEKVLSKDNEEIIKEVQDSNLKGRGGAGFPTGLKWSFLDRKSDKERYLVVNGDEGEPGTCKDRELIRHEPFKIIEGTIITSTTLGIKTAYIYIRGEFYEEIEVLQKAIDECYKANYLGENCLKGKYSLDIYIHKGAGAYICGEETALLESLEGKKGFPRLKPPFPASAGLYGCPTVINNIETIAVVPSILKNGAQWFASLGCDKDNTGTKLFCISGHVNNPCVVEAPMGVTLKSLINDYAGGVIGGWENLQAVIPGGSSTGIIPAKHCNNVTMDHETLKKLNSSVGTGAVMVFNNSVSIIDIMKNIISFYHHESCGQCTPCREGSYAVIKLIEKILNKTAKPEDIDIIDDLMTRTRGTTICALNDATSIAAKGFIRHYKDQLKSYMVG